MTCDTEKAFRVIEERYNRNKNNLIYAALRQNNTLDKFLYYPELRRQYQYNKMVNIFVFISSNCNLLLTLTHEMPTANTSIPRNLSVRLR